MGACGVLGATLLVSPLVNWQDGSAPTAPGGAYDPLLSEASCGDTASQLALSHRLIKEGEIQLASLDKDEIAFLEGIQPSGGEGENDGTGEDGPLNEVLKDLDDQTQNGSGTGDGEGGDDGQGGTPFVANFTPNGGQGGDDGDGLGDGGKRGDDGKGGDGDKVGDKGQGGGGPGEEGCEGSDCEEEVACIADCGNGPDEPQPLLTEPATLVAAEVSEPATLGLLGLGLTLLGLRRRRAK